MQDGLFCKINSRRVPPLLSCRVPYFPNFTPPLLSSPLLSSPLCLSALVEFFSPLFLSCDLFPHQLRSEALQHDVGGWGGDLRDRVAGRHPHPTPLHPRLGSVQFYFWGGGGFWDPVYTTTRRRGRELCRALPFSFYFHRKIPFRGQETDFSFKYSHSNV